MKRKIFRVACGLIIGTFLISCGAAYAPVSGRYVASAENFSVDLPLGWRQHNASVDPLRNITAILGKRHKLNWDVIRITRDGLLLQEICIGRISVTEELPNTKRKLAQKMIPLEAAQVMSDEFRSNSNLTHQEIIENAPAAVGGYPGFKLHYSYHAGKRLKVEGLFYGALVGPWLYYALYEAPSQHYFQKDLRVFDKTLSSFHIVKAGS